MIIIAEMLTDLLQNIYKRIAQLGQAIQALNSSLDGLNQNIEQKVTNLNFKLEEFTKEIDITKNNHVDVLREIGEGTRDELKKLQVGLGLDALQTLISKLEEFEKLSEEVLNQETVNLLLSEAINSVKILKEQVPSKL